MIDIFKLFYENISNITDLPFIKDIEEIGGYVTEQGGKVRDEFLGIDSKDLDVVIYKVKLDDVVSILKKYGNVVIAGNSFPVIKWKAFGSNEEIDIALPRIEKKIGDKRTEFEVTISPDITPEQDANRRDFTMNAIIKKINGDIIDPFNGRFDIKNKIIRMINPDTFNPLIGDELRMLRAVQFAARFNFKIEENTLKAIRKNAKTIEKTPKERIIEELKKILKGNVPLGVSYLIRTKLFNYIFKFDKIHFSLKDFKDIKSFSEFLFLLTFGNGEMNLGEYLKRILKINNIIEKEVEALNYIMIRKNITGIKKRRIIVSNALKESDIIFSSKCIPEDWSEIISEFKNGKYPKNVSELKIKGGDLLKKGYEGKKIKETLDKLLIKVYDDLIENTKEDLFGAL